MNDEATLDVLFKLERWSLEKKKKKTRGLLSTKTPTHLSSCSLENRGIF